MDAQRTDSFALTLTTFDPTFQKSSSIIGTSGYMYFSVATQPLPIAPDEKWQVCLSSITLVAPPWQTNPEAVAIAVRVSVCDSSRFGSTAPRDTLFLISPALMPAAPIPVSTLVYIAPRDAAQPTWVSVSPNAGSDTRIYVSIEYATGPNAGNNIDSPLGDAHNHTILTLAFQRQGLKQ